MKRHIPLSPFLLLLILFSALAMAGCGPKTVGEDSAKADDGYTNPANEPEAQLRYPLSGSRTEQRLYYINQPQVMAERLQRQREYYDRRLGLQPDTSANGDNSLFPKRYSPFR